MAQKSKERKICLPFGEQIFLVKTKLQGSNFVLFFTRQNYFDPAFFAFFFFHYK